MKNYSLDELAALYQFPKGTPLSEAIILAALYINPKNDFLPVKEYRDCVFSQLWERQFHSGANWQPQFRTELNQGDGRLAHRVFDWDGVRGIHSSWKLKSISKISAADAKVIERLKKLLNKITKGESLVDDSDEEVFQESVAIRNPVKLNPGKIKRPNKVKSSSGEKYARNPGISKAALEEKKFLCEIDAKHLTFTSPVSKQNFVEAHHLIPMEHQGDFKYSIDIPENIIALCPNCHRKIHYGIKNDVERMLSKLFNSKMRNMLKTRGIEMSMSKLKKLYS